MMRIYAFIIYSCKMSLLTQFNGEPEMGCHGNMWEDLVRKMILRYYNNTHRVYETGTDNESTSSRWGRLLTKHWYLSINIELNFIV